MPSQNKTPNISLNQWLGNEYIKRKDFAEDNLKIDEAIHSQGQQIQQVNGSLESHKDDLNSHIKIFTLDRIPVDLSSFPMGSILAIKENLFETSSLDWELGSLNTTTGLPTIDSNRIRTKVFHNILPSKSYKIDFLQSRGLDFMVIVIEYDIEENYLKSSDWQNTDYQFTSLNNTSKIKVIFRTVDDIDVFPEDIISLQPILFRIYEY
ncbi:hypothetical protein [Alkaliphilus peptidifermentans]|uniref:Uncharacterized protein n=1 Tax=Alkaliphilus peptidifermentans DSM 18978 TaxID=1120976 RepID=A0A1G5JYB0_9FIRM|nr:hypothetical protein [Alkaliphilus peptidifermentans]SCY92850.1 hypothetical protein SAMN03080606_03087 [Alkaliphilus peptidifermentans DSM 18978]